MKKPAFRLSLALLVVCTAFAVAAAQETIDFESVAPGTIVEQVFGDGGAGPIGVFGSNPDLDALFGPGSNAAVIFDSANPPTDLDLGTPHTDFGGPGVGPAGAAGSPFQNDTALNHILIINEAEDFVDRDMDGIITGADSPVIQTDDADNPGEPITLDFSAIAPVTVYAITLLDVEADEGTATVEFFDALNNPIGGTFFLPQTGDNGVALDVDLGPTMGVWTMRVVLNGSGAIDNIVFQEDLFCGDGMVNLPGETCDPPGAPAGASGNICRENCTVCGDGVEDPGEACDDGNNIAGDGCENDCTVTLICGDGMINLPGETCDPPGEPAGASGNICREDCTVCGDGIEDAGEECDDGNNVPDDGCENDCTVTLICGDGMINLPGETCDPPGEPAGASGNICREDCTVCGDGIEDAGEECDDGNNTPDDGCENDCTVTLICGDGMINLPGETCDPPGEPVGPFGNLCREDCTYCGDGIVDMGEACDPAAPDAPAGCQDDCRLCEGQIGDCVWHDGVVGMECDGIQEPDCANGLNGLEVRLYDDMGVLIRSTMTGVGPLGDGYYQFMDLCAGDYTVEIDTPDGLVTAPVMVGDPATDSNGSPAMVTLPADDTSDQTIDFGFCEEREGGEGCTPGYWKQEHHFGSWFGYTPDMLVGGVFGATNTHFPGLADDSLLDALEYGGGGGATGAARILLRAAVASLLNAASPDVAFDWAEAAVIADVNAALATEDRHTMLELAGRLDDDNNDGCPLGRAEIDPRASRPDAN